MFWQNIPTWNLPAAKLRPCLDSDAGPRLCRAEKFLADSPRKDFQDIDFSFYFPKSWYEAMIAREKGDSAKRRLLFESAAKFWRND